MMIKRIKSKASNSFASGKKRLKKMGKPVKGLAVFGLGLSLVLGMTGCSGNSAVISNPDGMKKVGSLSVEQEVHYQDESETEEVLGTFSSKGGLCVIEKHASYYDVTLDLEKGSHQDVGAAYAEALLLAVPEYSEVMEPYLYENIRSAFRGRDINYESLEKRIRTLEAGISDDYRLEIESFASTISKGEEGFSEDGKISYIEAMTMQMIPDALRGTACSALSLDGTKTTTGERLSLRNLEWNIGSQSQMTEIHCVTHFKKGEGTVTAISMLGLMDIITAVNDDGVLIGILDVGSNNSDPYVYEGKKCYTFEIRYALEHFSTAREAGEYMVAESGNFTWCHNLLCTDAKDAFCCEDATAEVAATGAARSVLRSTDSELMEGLQWDTPDALCIVNSFSTKGNQDGFSLSGRAGSGSNSIRFAKFNKWVSEKEKFSVGDLKGIMAHEIVDQYEVCNVHNDGTVHTVIVDYATGNIHVAFTTGTMTEDIPRYLYVGNY